MRCCRRMTWTCRRIWPPLSSVTHLPPLPPPDLPSYAPVLQIRLKTNQTEEKNSTSNVKYEIKKDSELYPEMNKIQLN